MGAQKPKNENRKLRIGKQKATKLVRPATAGGRGGLGTWGPASPDRRRRDARCAKPARKNRAGAFRLRPRENAC